MAQERLQKLIARAGLGSRREAERWIQEGRVTVNGKVVLQPGTQADAKRDRVAVDGKPLPHAGAPAYYMLCKPARVITSKGDPHRRRDLGEWLNPLKEVGRFFSVGRLDFNSEGLLLLTTDGELAHRLAHPRFGVAKRYRVKVSGVPGASELDRLGTGVELEDGWTAPAIVRLLSASEKKAWIEVEVHEGRNRLVRRMFEALGYSVERLVRVSFGPLRLGSLSPGEMRPLSAAEIQTLRRIVGLETDSGFAGKTERVGNLKRRRAR